MDDEPLVGVRYDVDAHDCCLDVDFSATLLTLDAESGAMTFDNGVTIRGQAVEMTRSEG